MFGALVLCTGAVSTRWLVLPRAAPEHGLDVAALHARAAGTGLASASLLLPAMGLVFVRQLAEFRDPFVPWTADADLLLRGTAWGRVYLLGLAGSAALPFAFLAARVRSGAWAVAGLLTLALGVFPAATGHASAAGPLRAVTLVADVLHVWAAGAWIGGLGVVLVLHRARGTSESGVALSALVRAFSPVALASVVLLVATGVLASWIHVPAPEALVRTAYGRTLLIKLAVVVAALAMGFTNWRRHTPRLGASDGPDRLARTGSMEFWLGQVVLLVTGALVRTPPP